MVWLATLLVATALAAWLGSRFERRASKQLTDALVRDGEAATAAPIDRSALATLPVPVERYLKLALGRAPRAILVARFRQVGRLRTSVDSERWMEFTAEHVVVPSATAFVWNARVALGRLLHLRVRDALVDGQGSGRVTLLSTIAVARAAGDPELDQGALHRYLAEAVWYPTALLPSQALRWTAIDDTRALATLTQGRLSVALEFRFDASGEVTGIFTPARWGRFDGAYRQVPWEGHFGRYVERGGMRVPSEGEVGWYRGDEWRCVWTGRVVDATYTLAP
jgi:hypothetical protein